MRKVLFGLTLILAAFSGGAAVNGPGLAWLKAAIKARLLCSTTPTNPQPVETAHLPDAPRDVPAARLPPLTLEPADRRPNPSDAIPLEPLGTVVLPLEPAITDPAIAPASRGPAPVPDGHRDWSEIRRRMRELGVTRYEVDGEPQGRSRFRCLIPLAGRRAVGQQFEGEGDDDYQAAEAALRRVSLWRATEMVPR